MNNPDPVLKISYPTPAILQLTLHRPEALNALNAELMEQLYQALMQAKNNSDIKAILIIGEGKAFCAGADIKQLALLNAQTGLEFARRGQMIFRTLEQLGKPSLAAINGYAFGGGCELAMAATLRIATTTAVFSQPEIKLGVIPGFGGTQRLARLIGKGRALEMCLTGKTIPATDAAQWGLISEVTAPAELLSRAQAILTQLAQLSPFALSSILRVIEQGYDLTLEEGLELEAAHFGLCCATQDKQEGVSAFIEKRPAVFQGE